MSKIVISQEQYNSLDEALRAKLLERGLSTAEAINGVELEELVNFASLTPEEAAAFQVEQDDPEPKAKGKGKAKAKATVSQTDPVQVRVRIITRENDSRLVEWVDGDDLRRGWVDGGLIVRDPDSGDTLVDSSELCAGGCYGDDFEAIVEASAKAPAVEIVREFHRAGIWTVADLLKNLSAAHGAFNAAHSRDFERLVNAARNTTEE